MVSTYRFDASPSSVAPSLPAHLATKDYVDTANGLLVPKSRSVSAGTGLTGGGDLTADRSLAVAYGTASGTAAQGNDSRITGAEQSANKNAANGYCGLDSSSLVPRSRYYLATTTLDGTIRLAGDLAGTGTAPTVPGLANKQDTSAKGAASGYASLDSGTKVPIAQIPTGTTSSTVAIGNDSRLSDSRAPSGAAGGALSGTYPNPSLGVVPNAPVTLSDAATVATDASLGTIFRVAIVGNRTLGVPTNATDGQKCIWEVTASGAVRTLTLTTGSAGSFAFGTDISSITATASGATDFIGAVYNSTAQRWRVIAYQKGY